MIAGGAAFAGFKAFEDHQRREGKTVNHAFAKELLAGFAAAEVDKLAETKGADWWDQERYVGLFICSHPIYARCVMMTVPTYLLPVVLRMTDSDSSRAKHDAKKNAERMYDEHYGREEQYDPNNQPPERLQQEYGNRW